MISPEVWYRVTRPVSNSLGGQKQMKRYLAVAVAITFFAAAARSRAASARLEAAHRRQHRTPPIRTRLAR